ncbi:MAG: hypothetical protein WDN26_06920 [Chitinophagaceae bacterium]
MLAKNEVAKIYETVMSTPGMSDEVKVNLKTSRRNLLLLNKAIERGVHGKEDDKVNVLEIVSKDVLHEISKISADLLERSGLAEINEKLKSF